MTTPRVETIWIAGDRWYRDPITGERVPGVSAIKGVIDKPGLMKGALNETAMFVVKNAESILSLSEVDPKAAEELVKGASRRAWDKKAKMGDGVHGIAEALLRRQLDPSKPQIKVTPLQKQFITQYARWHQKYLVQPIYVEQTVWNQTHNYAGTMDFFGELTLTHDEAEMLGLDGSFSGGWNLRQEDCLTITAIVDIKSGASGIWPETALQQTAYKRAEYVMLDDGTRLDMPEVDATFGLWLQPHGYAFTPVDCSEATWQAFLACRTLYSWNKRARTFVGKPLNDNAIKRQRKS
jgi:hypothetical protein